MLSGRVRCFCPARFCPHCWCAALLSVLLGGELCSNKPSGSWSGADLPHVITNLDVMLAGSSELIRITVPGRNPRLGGFGTPVGRWG